MTSAVQVFLIIENEAQYKWEKYKKVFQYKEKF
jgi:hypothetical protein